MDAPTTKELEELLQLEERHGTPDDAPVDEETQDTEEVARMPQELAAMSALVDTLTPPKHTCGRCMQLVYEPDMHEAVSGPFGNNWVCQDETECSARLHLSTGSRRKRKAPMQYDS